MKTCAWNSGDFYFPISVCLVFYNDILHAMEFPKMKHYKLWRKKMHQDQAKAQLQMVKSSLH